MVFFLSLLSNCIRLFFGVKTFKFFLVVMLSIVYQKSDLLSTAKRPKYERKNQDKRNSPTCRLQQ